MEPILPTPSNLEGQATSSDKQTLTPLASPETAPNTAVEQPKEMVSTAALPATPPLASPTQPIAASQNSSAQPVINNDSNDPQIADDVDVIEKEWVEKAKKIVGATKADPYQQEKEVSKLQADYLMKRYNKHVRVSE